MGLSLTCGPPGSGRTTHLLALAREVLSASGRVWWIGLPTQRAHLLRRLTADGYAAIGFEFLGQQQFYYRLLSASANLRPLVVGTERLVRVVEALREVGGALPTPGEARLFAAAIAEAKRFAVDPAAYAQLAADAEQRRFAAVYAEYQRRLTDSWDYDDVRLAALEFATSDEPKLDADLVIVDGLREIGPVELRILQGLARSVDVRLSLPTPPPGLAADHLLPARADVHVERYAAANPVEEGRWVMRSLKRDLFGAGMEPLDLAVIVPPQRARAFMVLAEEYGVPLMDETPTALVDQGPGRAIVDVLELLTTPTPTRLLAVPELEELGRLALTLGVAGEPAVTELARRTGLLATWDRWRERLTVRGDPVTWARDLIAELVPHAPLELRLQLLARAQEAARLGAGEGFTAWWVALLQDTRLPKSERAGVALIDAVGAAGRRYRKAYVVGAVEGTYGAREREDYFLPEESRGELTDTFARLGLPRRFQGRDAAVAAELLARADEVVLTAPRGDQEGQYTLDEALFGPAAPPGLPALPAGSNLELPPVVGYEADLSPVELGRPYVERLRRFSACSFRYWGERVRRAALPEAPPEDEGARLLSALLEHRNGRLDTGKLDELRASYPSHAAWLTQHADQLAALTFAVELGGREGYAAAFLHATRREELPTGRRRVTIVRFVPWEAAWDAASAEAALKDRWSEYWAVGALFEQPSFRVAEVRLLVWPLGRDPIDVAPSGVRPTWRRVTEKRRLVSEALPAFTRGDIAPNPGFICRDCPVFDLCREGER